MQRTVKPALQAGLLQYNFACIQAYVRPHIASYIIFIISDRPI